MFGTFRKRKNPLYIATSILIIAVAALAAGSAAILFAALLLLLVLFYPFFLQIWEWLYGVEDLADQIFHAHTEDGWNIAMHFHRPPYPLPGAYPVILSHGIANNKYGVDLDRGHSLAYYLKQNGFPVFVISLRGVGKSYHSSRYRYRDFTFDDIVENDVPAVIRKVRELTGAPKISWVGHSMGAMIAYGFLGRKLPGHEDIATLVSLGGPGKLDHARSTMWGLASRYPGLGQLLDLRWGAQVVSPLTGRVVTPIEELVYNKEVVNTMTIRRLMKNGVENIAPGLQQQFAEWIQSGQELTRDGVHDYRRGFQEIKLPVLFMAGARDHIAPVEALRFAYENTASKIKELHILGREEGVPYDYCHTGLVLGDRAILDVYPRVYEWLMLYGRTKSRKGLWGRITARLRRGRSRRPGRGRRRQFRDENLPSDVISA